MNINVNELTNNEKAYFIAMYFSRKKRNDPNYYLRNDYYTKVSQNLNIKYNTIKNWQDKLDPEYENGRKGWHKVKLSQTNKKLYEFYLEYNSLSDEELENVVQKIIDSFKYTTSNIKPTSLKEWINHYLTNSQYQEMHNRIIELKQDFLFTFPNLVNQLRLQDISLLEFKKIIDQSLKTKHDVNGVKINIWGFSGFSGQMFFNQLYNQSEHADMVSYLKNTYLKAIEIPAEQNDFNWTKKKYEEFGQVIAETKKHAIEKGFSPTRCANIKFSTFFLSFFWGIQNPEKYPIYYEATRNALQALGYEFLSDESSFEPAKYQRFAQQCQKLLDDIKDQTNKEFDMNQLSHFLRYVSDKMHEQGGTEEDDYDPINDNLFAGKLQDALNEFGYIVTNMETLEEPFEGYEDHIVWKFSCKKGNEFLSIIFVWENEEDYHCHLFIENEQGELRELEEINVEDEDEDFFIKELMKELTNHLTEKRKYTIEDAVSETFIEHQLLEEWLELLSEQKQIILYGPPGTGKTYVAQRLAKILSQNDNRVSLIQFHPSYTYEEFIEGLRPELVRNENGMSHLNVTVKPGLFTELCKEARKQENQNKSYVLIIDEINRGNTAKVFGELLYALEYRNTAIPLPYSKLKLVIPENIFIIGTMNTTDRSLSQLDFALRRRFQFIPFSTNETQHVLASYLENHQPDMLWVSDLVKLVNEKINNSDISIGHSYFIGKTLTIDRMRRIWKYQIIPYLEECFVHQPEVIHEFEFDKLMSEMEHV